MAFLEAVSLATYYRQRKRDRAKDDCPCELHLSAKESCNCSLHQASALQDYCNCDLHQAAIQATAHNDCQWKIHEAAENTCDASENLSGKSTGSLSHDNSSFLSQAESIDSADSHSEVR